MTKLSDFVNIRLGMAFKTAIKENKESEESFSLIQVKDISSDGLNCYESLIKVLPEVEPSNHILAKGDVLVRLRGPDFSSVVFDGNYPALTTNQVAILSCKKDLIAPYYLNWFLNSKHGKKFFSKLNEGSNIHKISSKALGTLPMQVPSLTEQEEITLICKNWSRQKELHKKLIINGDILNEYLCDNINSKACK